LATALRSETFTTRPWLRGQRGRPSRPVWRIVRARAISVQAGTAGWGICRVRGGSAERTIALRPRERSWCVAQSLHAPYKRVKQTAARHNDGGTFARCDGFKGDDTVITKPRTRRWTL